jgi:hypothetical protein
MTTARQLPFRRDTRYTVRRNATTLVSALALTLALGGCDRMERPGPDTTAIVFDESPGALASRHEAQSFFDAARAALIRKDFDGCLTSLTEAVAFFRAAALGAEPDARVALVAAAEELETLVANVARGRTRTARDFDRVFAQAHAAEAAHHSARARVALLKDDNVRAGEELLMSLDHLERAAKDARLRADSTVRAAIADTRTLASEMVKGTIAVPDEVARVTAEIGRAIRRIDTNTNAAATTRP